jgi:hypothetical protein
MVAVVAACAPQPCRPASHVTVLMPTALDSRFCGSCYVPVTTLANRYTWRSQGGPWGSRDLKPLRSSRARRCAAPLRLLIGDRRLDKRRRHDISAQRRKERPSRGARVGRRNAWRSRVVLPARHFARHSQVLARRCVLRRNDRGIEVHPRLHLREGSCRSTVRTDLGAGVCPARMVDHRAGSLHQRQRSGSLCSRRAVSTRPPRMETPCAGIRRSW